MRRSDSRVLTTHTGSLPRSAELRDLVVARESGRPLDRDRFEAVVRDEVSRIVRMQREAGLDVVNDGEQSKASFHRYRFDRLSGFEMVEHEPDPRHARAAVREAQDFPEFYERWTRQWRGESSEPDDESSPTVTLCCTGPIEWKDLSEIERDIANLIDATRDRRTTEIFMTSISPATYAPPNLHYASQDEYLDALADVMAVEYRAIVDAGLLLQIDAPDLTTMYRLADLTIDQHAEMTERSVEAINRATRDISPDRCGSTCAGAPTRHPITAMFRCAISPTCC